MPKTNPRPTETFFVTVARLRERFLIVLSNKGPLHNRFVSLPSTLPPRLERRLVGGRAQVDPGFRTLIGRALRAARLVGEDVCVGNEQEEDVYAGYRREAAHLVIDMDRIVAAVAREMPRGSPTSPIWHTGQGWAYLCVVRDGCTRRVPGRTVADSLHADMVEDALRQAVALRGELPGKS